MKKNALITLWYADGLHGGVKYSAELGNYLYSLGYNVYMCGVITNEKTKEFLKTNNVNLIDIVDFPTDIEFDLVWAHHWPIVPFLIKNGLKYKRIINSCISSILPIERFMCFPNNIDMFLTLTNVAKNMFVKEYDFPANKIYVLPNTAPDEFFEYKFAPRKKLQSIAVVSNHPPREIMDATKILKSNGYDVVIYGMQTKSVDITPEILSQYDVIVTIGKTVQYSLAMGIPVYNYDHFGGSGYITPQNIDEEENYNFSGRSHFTKKSGEQIANEIIREFTTVLPYMTELKEIANNRYRLSTQINAILEKLESMPPVPHIQISNSNRLFFDYCEFIINTCAERKVSNCIYHRKMETKWQRLWRHIRTMKF